MWLSPLRKQFAKVKGEAHGAWSMESKNYFDRMTSGLPDPERAKHTVHHSSLPFSLLRISPSIFSCSRQMDRRMVSNGHGCAI